MWFEHLTRIPPRHHLYRVFHVPPVGLPGEDPRHTREIISLGWLGNALLSPGQAGEGGQGEEGLGFPAQAGAPAHGCEHRERIIFLFSFCFSLFFAFFVFLSQNSNHLCINVVHQLDIPVQVVWGPRGWLSSCFTISDHRSRQPSNPTSLTPSLLWKLRYKDHLVVCEFYLLCKRVKQQYRQHSLP